ncbi:MAG: hypothetical protein H7A50_05785 [Akkermansiaceae bacterium]|nr:hypothetical protein [Akkermansiaceae bacterium]
MKARFPCFLFRSALLSTIVLSTGLRAQDTGFLQIDAGPYDYNDTANWVDGTINGIWDDSLTLTASQTATFDAPTNLGTGLEFLYDGGANVTLAGSGGAQTITLGGDITVNTVQNRTIYVGTTSAGSAIDVNLGGDRAFHVAGSKALYFYNSITNGDILMQGISDTSAGSIRFERDSGTAVDSDITVRDRLVLYFDNSATGIGATRANSLTLQSGGELFNWGNNSMNSVNVVTGALTVDGDYKIGSFSSNALNTVSLRNAGAHSLLQVGDIVRKDHGILFLRGTNLGSNTIASATGGDTSFTTLGSAPTLTGGGGTAGDPNISILPWAVGATSYSSAPTTFLTYTAAEGFRPLNVSTEFSTTIGVDPTENVRLVDAADTAISGDETVNSLILSGQGGSISGSAPEDTLTVTSGAVLLTRTTGASSPINVNLDFGSAEGLMGYVRGDTVNGAIAGSGGLTVFGNRTDENLRFLSASCTYTGDTHVLGNMMVDDGVLPSGGRTGNVHVSGNLQLDVSGYNGTINGLFGNGTVKYGNSGSSSLTFGDNDATADFAGSIISNSNLKLYKIGTGTQTLSGENLNNNTTAVNEGTLLVNGSLGSTSTVTVDSGATLGGTGTIAGPINAAGTVAPGASVGTLTTGDATLTGNLAIEVDGAGADKLLSTGAIDITNATLDVTEIGAGFTLASYVIAEGTTITGPFLSVPSGYEVNIVSGGVGEQAVLTSTGGPSGYASWASTNVGGQEPSEDFNGDGVSNGIAYFMDDTGAITLPGIVGGAVAWTNGGNISSSAYGSEFLVQTSDDLVVWDDIEDTDPNLTNTAGSVSYSLPTGETKIFVRLKVAPN